MISAKEVTKRSIRVETWEKFRENRCSPVPTPSFKVFNRVPNFEGAEKAAALLAETDEFKNASKQILRKKTKKQKTIVMEQPCGEPFFFQRN